MARGNQRDKAREKNQKAQAGIVSWVLRANITSYALTLTQKSKNTASGSQQQRDKEAAAEIMRKKQEAGMVLPLCGE